MKSTLGCAPCSSELAHPRRYSAKVRPLVDIFRCVTPAVVFGAACLFAGCSGPAPEPAAAQPAPQSAASRPAPEQAAAATPYQLVASIREVMNSVIDPNIDVVWNAVRTVIDHGKSIEYAPANDEEWAAARRSAVTVIEGANLLMMPGRSVAPAGAGSLSPGVELAPEEVRALIDSNRAGWNQFARSLQDRVKVALAAIDKKDKEALFEAGDGIDEVCEACHQVYWYPGPAATGPKR